MELFDVGFQLYRFESPPPRTHPPRARSQGPPCSASSNGTLSTHWLDWLWAAVATTICAAFAVSGRTLRRGYKWTSWFAAVMTTPPKPEGRNHHLRTHAGYKKPTKCVVLPSRPQESRPNHAKTRPEPPWTALCTIASYCTAVLSWYLGATALWMLLHAIPGGGAKGLHTTEASLNYVGIMLVGLLMVWHAIRLAALRIARAALTNYRCSNLVPDFAQLWKQKRNRRKLLVAWLCLGVLCCAGTPQPSSNWLQTNPSWDSRALRRSLARQQRKGMRVNRSLLQSLGIVWRRPESRDDTDLASRRRNAGTSRGSRHYDNMNIANGSFLLPKGPPKPCYLSREEGTTVTETAQAKPIVAYKVRSLARRRQATRWRWAPSACCLTTMMLRAGPGPYAHQSNQVNQQVNLRASNSQVTIDSEWNPSRLHHAYSASYADPGLSNDTDKGQCGFWHPLRGVRVGEASMPAPSTFLGIGCPGTIEENKPNSRVDAASRENGPGSSEQGNDSRLRATPNHFDEIDDAIDYEEEQEDAAGRAWAASAGRLLGRRSA